MNVDLNEDELKILMSGTFVLKRVLAKVVGDANEAMLMEVIGAAAKDLETLRSAQSKVDKALLVYQKERVTEVLG